MQPRWAKLASPMELTTSRIRGPQTRRSCTSYLERDECSEYCSCQRLPASFRRPLTLVTFRNRWTESIDPMSGRPCPLYATIFHHATKDRIIDERIRNGHFWSLCAEHRTEVLERVNLLQWLTIMQDNLALTTRDDYWHYLGLRSVNGHGTNGGVVVTSFKYALYFHVVVTH